MITAVVAPVFHDTVPAQRLAVSFTEAPLHTASAVAVIVGGVWFNTVITASFDGLLVQPLLVQVAV